MPYARNHKESKVEYLIAIKELTTKIINFVNNQNKSGKKPIRNAMADQVCELSLKILESAYCANEIYISKYTCEADYIKRRDKLQEAQGDIKTLGISMEIYLNVLHNSYVKTTYNTKDENGNIMENKSTHKEISDYKYQTTLKDVSISCNKILKMLTGVLKSDLDKFKQIQKHKLQEDADIFSKAYTAKINKIIEKKTKEIRKNKQPYCPIIPVPEKMQFQLDPGYGKKGKVVEAIHFFNEIPNHKLDPGCTDDVYRSR